MQVEQISFSKFLKKDIGKPLSTVVNKKNINTAYGATKKVIHDSHIDAAVTKVANFGGKQLDMITKIQSGFANFFSGSGLYLILAGGFALALVYIVLVTRKK